MNNRPSPFRSSIRPSFVKSKGGFSLAELLVAMAVLVLLIAIVAQMTDSVTNVTTASGKHMDADSEARMVFDRMASDFARMVKRTDVDCILAKQPGNDAIFFYSEAPGSSSIGAYNAKNSVSLIGYRIHPNVDPVNPGKTINQLERLGELLTWDGATSNDATATTANNNPGGMMFLTYSGGIPVVASTLQGNWSKTIGTAANNYTDGVNLDYHTIGDQVYRMEISFLLKDGSISTKPVMNPSSTKNALDGATPPSSTVDSNAGYMLGSRWYDSSAGRGYICINASPGDAVWAPIGIHDISAIIVAIAILDSNSREIVPDTVGMISALPDAIETTPILQTWSGGPYLTASGIPKAAASQIRIYQRCFYLNNK